MDNSSDQNNIVTKLKVGVHKKFAELRAALQMREKLLLRQLEVVASTTRRMTECGGENNFLSRSTKFMESDDINILFENEDDLLGAIRTFGQFQLGSMLLALKQEDYITPNCDHETMYKNIETDNNQCELLPRYKNASECIVVDFSKEKSLIEHNTKYINDSIVNITLEEAKELIRKTRAKNETSIPPLNLEEFDDELESSIAEAVSNLNRESNSTDYKLPDMREKDACKNTKIGPSKQKITINNCSGTINLRNISSVTINCGNEKCEHGRDLKTHKNSADLKNTTMSTNSGAIVPCAADCVSDYSTPSSVGSFSNQSSNSSSRSQSKKHKKTINTDNSTKKNINGQATLSTNDIPNVQSNSECINADSETRGGNCDFYNRLLNEIKRNLDQQKLSYDFGRYKKSSKTVLNQTQDLVSLNPTMKKEPQLVLKNFDNLNIILKNDTHDETVHPVHIEHWLSEIIKDTDLEPMQNTDILEHSKINE